MREAEAMRKNLYTDPCTSYWLRSALEGIGYYDLKGRDVVDCLGDLGTLIEFLKAVKAEQKERLSRISRELP